MLNERRPPTVVSKMERVGLTNHCPSWASVTTCNQLPGAENVSNDNGE